MTEIYAVSWTNHESDRTLSVKNMLENNTFVDVTLVCDDDQLEAHKVLLSAASPFFNQILQRNPHSHPLIYLRGSLKKDVSAILDFIYSGETKVPEVDLESFMSLAKDLQIKGLVEAMLQNDSTDRSKNTQQILSSKSSQNIISETKVAPINESTAS